MGTINLNDLLEIAAERGTFNLHLKVGSFPMLRLRDELTAVSEDHRVDHDDMMARVGAGAPPPASKFGG